MKNNKALSEFHKTLKSKGYSFEFDHETNLTKVTYQGGVYLRSLTTLPDGIQFNNQGGVYLRSLTTLPDGIQFNNQGDVDLNSLTTLPDGIQFNNQGYVDLNSLTTLPDGIQFNNQGGVYLRSLKNFDAINCGNEKRNITVFYGAKIGLRTTLGCFMGTEDECIAAIEKKYGKESAGGKAYIKKVKSAFEIGRERYKHIIAKSEVVTG